MAKFDPNFTLNMSVAPREFSEGEVDMAVELIAVMTERYKGPVARVYFGTKLGMITAFVFRDEAGALTVSDSRSWTVVKLAEDVKSSIIRKVEEEIAAQASNNVPFNVICRKLDNQSTKIKGWATLITPYGQVGSIRFGWNGTDVLLFQPTVYIKPKEEEEAEAIVRDGCYKMPKHIQEHIKQMAYEYMVKEKLIVTNDVVSQAVSDIEEETISEEELEAVSV